ncbi:SsgA family sporulation/cell division regulator [Streptomyces tagetis]|uniref:SsgA family sporulation/cell division regulator n=1 Tax=Streptomyces tagetis TaxID=2820809 RepID=A0A940XFM4_9ACTN|nr:SsgA family sporulation/cell division regulator [Streptomyces sp. RG38]MBQ0829458.1 SsgA family sporulation/cell division regulator [Streptomyces sp. RG38]
MSAVEQYVRARIVTEADVAPDATGDGALPVLLRYDPAADPGTVRVALPQDTGPREWAFPRELLERGLRAPAGTGDVRVWPCGRVQTVIEFHAGDACSVVQFENRALTRFLRRTHRAAAEPVAH